MAERERRRPVKKDPFISLVHEGTAYNLRANDFTALDELEIWRRTGATLLSIFRGGATLFTVAALVWRHRVNHGEDDLTYEDVARTFSYSSLESLSDEPKDGGPPEAPGGDS